MQILSGFFFQVPWSIVSLCGNGTVLFSFEFCRQDGLGVIYIYMNGNTWPQLLNCCGKVISSTGRFYNVSQQGFSLEGREIKQYRWCIWHMLALTFSHKRLNYLKWRHSLLLHNPGTYFFSEQLQFVLLPRPVVSTCGSWPPSGSHIRYLFHDL